MSVNVIDTIKPKNYGTFPVVEAADVKVSDSQRLDAALNSKANQSDLNALSTVVAGKASQSDLNALSTTVSGKQNALTSAQLTAVNSGITSSLVAQIRANTSTLDLKASQADLNATNATVSTKADSSDVSTSISNLQTQIDNIVTPVTEDAEVENARVGADGTSYASLKARIDSEVTELSNTTKDIADETTEATQCIYVGSMYDTRDGYYISYTTGNINANADYCASIDYIPIKASTTYRLQTLEGNFSCQVAWYDSDKTYISGTTDGTFNVPAEAAYLRVSYQKTFKSSMMLLEGAFAVVSEYTTPLTIKNTRNKNTIPFSYFAGRENPSYGESIVGLVENGFEATFLTRFAVAYTAVKTDIEAGSFVFGRMKIKCNRDISQINIQVIFGSETSNNFVRRTLAKNKEYTLYFISNKAASSYSNTNVFVRPAIFNAEEDTATLNVSDFCICINNYDAYTNEENKLTLPNFDTTTYVVGNTTDCHFVDIYGAVEFAKKTHDVANEDIVIFVKNGVYDLYIGDSEPYAINKGNNRISIIGESKNGVILQKTCTDTKQGRIIDGGGACSYENMTLIQYKDESYVSEYNDSRPYCIHVDGDFSSETEYITLLRNLRCVNHVNAPVGAGLRNNQKLVYENCELEFDGVSNAAFYTHGPNDPEATGCSLVVDNCTINHLSDTGRAMLLDNVPGCLTYAEIPCTFTRNAVYSKSGTVVESGFKSTHDVQPISSLNNVEALNF